MLAERTGYAYIYTRTRHGQAAYTHPLQRHFQIGFYPDVPDMIPLKRISCAQLKNREEVISRIEVSFGTFRIDVSPGRPVTIALFFHQVRRKARCCKQTAAVTELYKVPAKVQWQFDHGAIAVHGCYSNILGNVGFGFVEILSIRIINFMIPKCVCLDSQAPVKPVAEC